MEGSDRWSQVQGSGLRWKEAVSGGGERSQVDLRCRGAVYGAGERSTVHGSGR